MFVVRVVGIIAAIIIGAGVVAWLLTRDRRYLVLSGRVALAALAFAVLVVLLIAAERLLVIL